MTEHDDSSNDDVVGRAEQTIAEANEPLKDYPTPTELTGKVVGFLNTREVIMNVGRVDGVKVGMQFAILVPGGVPVLSDEGEELGRVDVPKAIVKVVRVDGDHLSIGRTFMTIKGRPARDLRSVLGYGPGTPMPRLLDQVLYQEAVPDRVETFDVTKPETVRADVDLTVRKGDGVRLTLGDEYIFPG